MTENDLLRASPSKLQELAKFYGLRLQGKRNLWVCRKSASHPLTKKQHFFKWSTQTADLRTALLRAIPKVEDFLAQIQTHLAAPVRSANNQFFLGELKKSYMEAPTVQATPASRKRNWGDLERIVRIVHGPESDPASMSVGVINRELAKEYQRRRLVQIEAGAKGDMLAIEAGKRAMNSTLAHAQSVFSRQALEDFHALRLPPTVRDFADALPVKARRQEEPQPLADAFVSGLLGKVEELRAVSPAAWATFQLMLWGGLRNVDCLHVRRSWLHKENDGYRLKLVLTADYMPKGSSGAVILPAVVVERILALPAPEGQENEKDPHLVRGSSPTARVNAIYREVQDWLKTQGVEEEASKIAYRLRKFFLSKVADQQGRAMAQLAGRHADGSTTSDHYIGAPKMQKPIALS